MHPGDSSHQGSHARRFYLLLRVFPLNFSFLARWSGSHGSLAVVGTSKPLMQAQHSICSFRCTPVVLATRDCLLWVPLGIHHIRPLLNPLLLGSLHPTTRNGVRVHTGKCFPLLPCPTASGEGFCFSSVCTSLSTSILEFLECKQAPGQPWLRNTMEEEPPSSLWDVQHGSLNGNDLMLPQSCSFVLASCTEVACCVFPTGKMSFEKYSVSVRWCSWPAILPGEG